MDYFRMTKVELQALPDDPGAVAELNRRLAKKSNSQSPLQRIDAALRELGFPQDRCNRIIAFIGEVASEVEAQPQESV